MKEKERKPVPHISFGERLRLLPAAYRRFLVAVGLFGAGDFAHTLLILLATQKLAPSLGAAEAASIAVGLYVVHNVFYAAFSLVAGWLADRLPSHLLAGGYSLAAVMAVHHGAAVDGLDAGADFYVGRVYVAIEETLEDSFCAELVEEEHHGMAFGVLATVNGVGDSCRAWWWAYCGSPLGLLRPLAIAWCCRFSEPVWSWRFTRQAWQRPLPCEAHRWEKAVARRRALRLAHSPLEYCPLAGLIVTGLITGVGHARKVGSSRSLYLA